MFPVSQEELCLRKFQSAKVRWNTMETQNEIALYKKFRCKKNGDTLVLMLQMS